LSLLSLEGVVHFKANCRIAFSAGSDYPDIRRNAREIFEMIAFYVSLALFGTAIIGHVAAKSRRERLQPVRVRSTEGRIRQQ
jgi:hypothetical protein